MHEGGSSSGGRFHQSHHITPDHNPAFEGRRGGEFGRCYRELACFQVSLMRRVLSRSLSLVKSLDSLVVNLCSRGFSRAQEQVLMEPGQWMLPGLIDYPDIAAGRGETLDQSRELGIFCAQSSMVEILAATNLCFLLLTMSRQHLTVFAGEDVMTTSPGSKSRSEQIVCRRGTCQASVRTYSRGLDQGPRPRIISSSHSDSFRATTDHGEWKSLS